MTFVKRAARTIAGSLAVLLPAVVAAEFLLPDEPAGIPIVGILGWALGAAVGAGLALPVVSLLLVRLRRQDDVVDRSWRAVALAMSVAIAGIGGLSVVSTVGVWRAPGLGLVAVGIAGLVAALKTRPVPRTELRFRVTGAAVLLTLVAALTLPYFGNTRERAYEGQVRSELRNAISELVMQRRDPTATEPPPLQPVTGVTLGRRRESASWLLTSSHQQVGLRCRAFLPNDAMDAEIECVGGSLLRGSWLAARMSLAYLAGTVLLFAAGWLARRRGKIMKSTRPSGYRMGTSGFAAKPGSKP